MLVDWKTDIDPMALYPRFDARTDGKPRLLFSRLSITNGGDNTSYKLVVVGEVDGPINFAMMQEYPEGGPGCMISVEDLNEGRFAIGARGTGSGPSLESLVDGVILGEIGKLTPHAALRQEDEIVPSWRIGQHWLVRALAPGQSAELYPADLKTKQWLWKPSEDSESLPISGDLPQIIGKDILFEVGHLYLDGIMAYDGTNGVHPLVRWYGDSTQGAGNMGTDGKHIVWTHGEGKKPAETVYPTRSIVASPYTTDPKLLQPKRLRSDPNPVVGAFQMAFAVGCGYAAHRVFNPDGMLVVRISDGVSWFLPSTNEWKWGTALGITCEDVFSAHFGPKGMNIARVRLDSLGPGIPPD